MGSIGKPCSCIQFIKSRIFYCKSCKNPYQYYKSCENPYQVLQVTHACVWTCNEIEGSYDKIIITIAPSYTGKNIARLLPLALLLVLWTHNNTAGNKLVIFSGKALYYGDNYIILWLHNSFHVHTMCFIPLFALILKYSISQSSSEYNWRIWSHCPG